MATGKDNSFKIRFNDHKEKNRVLALIDSLKGPNQSYNDWIKSVINKEIMNKDRNYKNESNVNINIINYLDDIKNNIAINEMETRTLLALFMQFSKTKPNAFDEIELNGKHGVPKFIKDLIK